MELRERKVTGLNSEASINPHPTCMINSKETFSSSADSRQATTSALHPISEQEAEDKGLPALKFMPLILRTPFICSALAFNILILGLLFTLLYYERFIISNQWGYFAIQILPAVLGTITASIVHGIAVNLSRVTPFMLAAVPEGSTFRKTILASYFPGLSLRDAIATGNGLLASVWILEILFGMILSFKSALLNTTDYRFYVEAIVTSWALYALIALYSLMGILTIFLVYELHDRVTGLRWEPASIADLLILFRHSDFLDKFEGTDIAARDSIFDRLQGDSLKIGYWYRGDEIWHGFGGTPGQVRRGYNPE
jgi:hypothetical protein